MAQMQAEAQRVINNLTQQIAQLSSDKAMLQSIVDQYEQQQTEQQDNNEQSSS